MENKKQIVEIKNIEIGKGVPKICVSIQGKNKEEIVTQAEKLSQVPSDLIEWRSDDFENVEKDLEELLKTLNEKENEKPLVFTYRTSREGGNGKADASVCKDLSIRAIKSGKIDLLDVEFSMDESSVKELIDKAHEVGIKVIISSHDFKKTPSVENMIQKMCRMQDTGADIIKLAVMPDSKEDVLNLMYATEKMERLYAKRPLITMSMSDMGAVSRFCGGMFGSSVTFAAGVNPSAPGQPKADELQKVLSIVYKSI